MVYFGHLATFVHYLLKGEVKRGAMAQCFPKYAPESVLRAKNAKVSTDYKTSQIFPGTSFDKDGALKVDSYLRVENCSDVYALGDVVNANCEKRPENAKKQASVIAENIKAAILLEGHLQIFQAGK